MVSSRFSTEYFVILVMFTTLHSAYALEDVPSYKKALDTFTEKSKQSKKPSKFSEEDKAVMAKAGEDLLKTMPDPGLKVGDKAPDFVLKNAFGKKVRLSKVLKKGPVVLSFYRGAWCPFCNLQLRILHKSLPFFNKQGAQLILITPQKPDKSKEQLKKSKYSFEVLSDLDSQVIKSYNLYFKLAPELVKVYKKHGLDIELFNGKGRNELPVPGTFVIDRKGIIRAAHAEVDYKARMEPADIIKALKSL